MEYRKIVVTTVVVCMLTFGCSGLGMILDHQYKEHAPVSIMVTGDEGTVSINGSGSYSKGSTVKLTATIGDGFVFNGWYDSKGKKLSTSNPYEFKATDNVSITADTVVGYSISTYRMHGISKVTGEGSYTDKDATVTATLSDGYIFKGWYTLDGTKVSDDLSYTFTDKKNHSVVAKTDSGHYLGNEILQREIKEQMKSGSIVWIITDWRTGEYVNSFTDMSKISFTVSPGKYDISVKGLNESGSSVQKKETAVIEGSVENFYLWYYNSDLQYLDWFTEYSIYNDYQKSKAARHPTTNTQRAAFMDYTSTSLDDVVQALTEKTQGFTEIQRANYVLKFVQNCTDYEYDEDYNGQSEYWKYPYETLYDRSGDCEDTSILYCTLMKKMGYDTALLVFMPVNKDGHAAAGIAFSGSYTGGDYIISGGKTYYYCETTSDTMNVGEGWSEYPAASATYVVAI